MADYAPTEVGGGEPPPPAPARLAPLPGGIRRHAARGTIINAGFSVSLVTLGLLRGLIVAAFLTPAEYGVWGILMVSLLATIWIKQAGIGDKFVQQTESDQELAFQKAFTLELAFNCAVAAIFVCALPVMVLVYGRDELLAPGLVIALTLPISVFQAPSWIFYRRMDFVRQRLLLAVDPIVGFAVTVALAVAGAGYWSLVVGLVVGAACGSVAAVVASPCRLRLRYERGTARGYLDFSWPLVVAGGASIVIAQTAIIAGELELGLAGAGAITLASTISQYSNRVDGIVTGTLYPAICAVRDRKDLLLESFVKSNRLALMWGVPFGVGLSLFAEDFVHYVLGDKWAYATFLLQVFGGAAALGHVAFNWDAFFRARGETRPIAVWSVLTMVSFLAVPLPLLLLDGLHGFAIGMGVMTAVSLAIRCWYVARLFQELRVLSHALRAVAPSVPAVGCVLALRWMAADVGVISELVLYLGVSAVATVWVERALLSEVLGYLRRLPSRPVHTAA